MQVKVTGTTYYRDTKSTALINSDTSGLQNYLDKRKLAESQRQEINNVRKEMENIKSDVQEIKILMQQLLKKG